jgi:1-acyl-sn-glycerol-3-phosphate acyltransferase
LCRLGQATVDLYAQFALKMDVQWQAPLPAGAKIIVANHPTTLDPFLMLHIIREPVNILVTGGAFTVPVFGRLLRRAGHVPVIRGHGRVAVEEAQALLEAGRTLVVFPEGALSPDVGSCNRPRTGAARLALAAGVPVVPMGIHLQPERVRPVGMAIEGEDAAGRIYYGGPYAVTAGGAMHFQGDVEDHAYVRSVGAMMMQQIVQLARQSARRMHEAEAAEIPAVAGEIAGQLGSS